VGVVKATMSSGRRGLLITEQCLLFSMGHEAVPVMDAESYKLSHQDDGR
jgi:hypothetical protein